MSRAPTPTLSPLAFGHPPTDFAFWQAACGEAAHVVPTPFYVFSAAPVEAAVTRLEGALGNLPITHWYSFKTQPYPPLLTWWKERGGAVEVVSENEFLAATALGYSVQDILINGPAKARWLSRLGGIGQRVHFDSPAEVKALLPQALDQHWRVGIRFNVGAGGVGTAPNQFGMDLDEARLALRWLRGAKVAVESVHFHVGTQLASHRIHLRALHHVARACATLGVHPRFVDLGGGLPAPHVLTPQGQQYDSKYSLPKLASGLLRARPLFPALEAYWMESGRHLMAGSGVLAVTVLETRERQGLRYLICNGGRTNHAMVATWEQHACVPLLKRTRLGASVPTVVTGPTCMAWDTLGRWALPRSLKAGDTLLWLDAGAYALPWETRFSHGLAALVWENAGHLEVTRPAESFTSWWGPGTAAC